MKNTDIYKMELHDRLAINGGNFEVIRVPGGWIYATWNHVTNQTGEGVFVPWHKVR